MTDLVPGDHLRLPRADGRWETFFVSREGRLIPPLAGSFRTSGKRPKAAAFGDIVTFKGERFILRRSSSGKIYGEEVK